MMLMAITIAVSRIVSDLSGQVTFANSDLTSLTKVNMTSNYTRVSGICKE